MTYIVRAAHPADIAAMNLLGDAHGWEVTTEDTTDRLSLHTADAAYVCEQNGAITGWIYCANRTGWGYRAIDRLLVDPNHRGTGMARALVEQVLRDFASEEVLIAAWDRELHQFYEKLGFHVDSDDNMNRLPARP
ncbi:GNAT family N-acetyltransferase [Streptomyces sp. NPDC087850]|uniref:GNAT family N-acetyltransferase n=1 Tax=Streptomyces sp. NPDC087850 TaxID=3365809 RepID=UPI003801BC51